MECQTGRSLAPDAGQAREMVDQFLDRAWI
jgi:hypothetical protein